jgi:3-oxoacyl-[acyl-carrier-protein] synthase II
MSGKRRVVVTGMGVVSAIGSTVADFWASLVAGRSGVRLVRPGIVAASVDFNPEAHFSRMELTTLDRFAQFALVASGEAIQEANVGNALASLRAGVYFGSGLGGASAIESSYRAFLDPAQGRVAPMTVVLTMPNAAAAHISMRHGVRGPTLTYSVACASAAVAIGEAFRALRDGYVDLAVAGGAEALLVDCSLASWSAMRVLAAPDAEHPERSCRPFAQNRSGLVLGEGAGAIVLESLEHAQARGASPLAELAGYGIASDASHLAKPLAEGQAAAMRNALADAQVPPAAIGYVNAHGTATAAGDVVETESIKLVFGDTARSLPVSSTKALHGHLLGAYGAIELIAAIMALRTRTLPPTAHLDRQDPACDLDYVPNSARAADELEMVMSNSFAFGGTNAALIARRI